MAVVAFICPVKGPLLRGKSHRGRVAISGPQPQSRQTLQCCWPSCWNTCASAIDKAGHDAEGVGAEIRTVIARFAAEQLDRQVPMRNAAETCL